MADVDAAPFSSEVSFASSLFYGKRHKIYINGNGATSKIVAVVLIDRVSCVNQNSSSNSHEHKRTQRHTQLTARMVGWIREKNLLINLYMCAGVRKAQYACLWAKIVTTFTFTVCLRLCVYVAVIAK